MRTTNVTTTEMNVNVNREAYVAPQVEVIEMEAEGSLMIVTSPGADDNGDPSPSNAPSRAPFWRD